MTAENLNSTPLSNLDSQPIVVATSGEGAQGDLRALSDNGAPTAAYGSAAKNNWAFCRFPVQAKVKHVWFYAKGLDSNSTATLTMDVNVRFSDSPYDFTPAALQGQYPQSALTGAVTSLSSSTSMNKMFGAAITGSNSGAAQNSEITYKNTYTPAMKDIPMWANMGGSGVASAAPLSAGGGFAQDSAGNIVSPGGFFDLSVVVAATAATAAAGTLGLEVDFVV